MSLQYALLAAIQNRAAKVLNEFRGPDDAVPDSPLLKLLRSDVELPDIEIFDAPSLLERLDLDGLLSSVGSRLKALRANLRDRDFDLDKLDLDLDRLDFGNLKDFGKKLLDGDPITEVRNAIDELRGKLGDRSAEDAIRGIVRRQIGIGISFITTLKNLADIELPKRVLDGWKQYYFSAEGFQTVDGISIVAPAHDDPVEKLKAEALNSGNLQQGLKGLRGLLSERSAEQYVRDLTRIVVEVGGDTRYRLRDRLPQLQAKLGDPAKAAKAQRWFKGAASMTEAFVTSAVEELSLGIAQFQTNPVLAAAAGTYAGTAARKASQHAFLADCDV
jgi:hypothetical protein